MLSGTAHKFLVLCVNLGRRNVLTWIGKTMACKCPNPMNFNLFKTARLCTAVRLRSKGFFEGSGMAVHRLKTAK